MGNFVSQLNELIATALPNGISKKLNGIVEPIVYRNDGDMIIPMICTPEGECSHVFDDTFDLGLYHKINNKSYGYSKGTGYGNDGGYTCKYDMSLIVYGKKQSISALDAEKAVFDAIRNHAEIRIVSFDRISVFNGEFSGLRFFLQPHIFLIKIGYNITTIINKCNK